MKPYTRAAFGYPAALLLAAAAQAARLPMHPPTVMPSITYVPFIVLTAWLAGLGPGLAATAFCTLESLYFATAPAGSFRLAEAADWEHLCLLAITGTIVSLLFERMRQIGLAEKSSKESLRVIIENSPVATAVLNGPDLEFEMVNAAYQGLAPGEPMIGRTVAQVWPAAAYLVMPLLEEARRSQTVYQAIGMALPLHRGPETPVEDRYFDFSYVPLGSGGRLLVVANEVTAYKRAEQALRAAHQELALVHAHIPVALLVVDDLLRVRKANAAAFQMGSLPGPSEGARPGDVLGCGIAGANPQGCGHGRPCGPCSLGNAAWDTIRNGVRHNGLEAWLPRGPGDSPRCLLVSTAPMEFEGRKALICAQDITGRKHAELALRESQVRLQAALAEAENHHHLLAAVLTAQTDGIVVCDTRARVIRTNPTAILCFGFDPLGMLFADVAGLLNLERGAGSTLTLKALAGETTVDAEQSLGPRTMETSAAPVRNAEGSIIGAVTVMRDITRRKQAEDSLQQTVRELEEALTEKTVLIKEVHHRVKNNLAVISSLLNMKAEASQAGEAQAALADSHQRVQTIALIHEHLYGNEHLDRVHFGRYARELAQQVYAMSVADPSRISLRIEAQPIELGVHRAVPCALILNELLTNAFKHAFPGGRSGEIVIRFHQLEAQLLELVVEDNGVGAPSDFTAAAEKSLGFRIVTILTRQLGGTLERQPATGTRFVLRFPAPSARLGGADN